MAAANLEQDARKGARNTPGRRMRTGNQYFDVGKVGRKTGIVLIDTGVRDEHGMEPMSGIFSSPASPEKRAQGTSSSNAMELQESSAPDVDETLYMRKTPRLPPARASTPRHTNIGSPKRMSSARPQSRSANMPMASEISPHRASTQPPPNRVLNFNRQNARADTGSPFKPKRVLRRSDGGMRHDRLEEIPASSPSRDARPSVATMNADISEDESVEEAGQHEVRAGAEVHSDEPESEVQQHLDDDYMTDAPPAFDDDDNGYYDTNGDAHDIDISEALEHAEVLLQTTPSATHTSKTPRGRPRKSIESTETGLVKSANNSSSSKKRDRAEMEDDQDGDANETLQSIDQSQNDLSQVSAMAENPAKRSRGRPRKKSIAVLQDPNEQTADDADQTIQSIEDNDQELSQASVAAENPKKRGRGRPRKSDVTIVHENTEQTIDPSLLAHGDSYLAPVNEDDEVEAAPAPPVTKVKPEKKSKAQTSKKSQKAPKERDPNQSMRRTVSASPGKADRDRALGNTPTRRAGSVSNVNLRASTPFEDAHQRMSRSGRPILKPLKHWAGESYVWKNGEVEGIIRADEVKTPRGSKKTSKSKRRVTRANRKGAANGLDIIAEESDTESTVPDEWEEQMGVIAGTVAAWDPDAQQGNPEEPIREDIAFASSSIVTRDVAGSAFQYAKIMTLPFFGSGIVELPPEGYKRAKNSRKMQMVFFVHEGKVLVTVGPPATEQSAPGSEPEVNEFAISKGGVWVVPRGNNYSISNESRTKHARIFFAQGCEVEPELASQQ